MSVKQCMRDIDSREFGYWMAHSRKNPIGGIRGDVQAAIIAQQIDKLVQLKCDGKATAKELTAFMPFVKKEPKQQTPEQMLAMFKMITGSSPTPGG